jgi:hypothetical protein
MESFLKTKNITLVIFICLSLLASFFLLNVKVDRVSANLQPDEGITHGQVIKTNNSYQQSFLVNTDNISKFGLFIRPAVASLPAGNFSISLQRGNEDLLNQSISTSLIDSDAATYLKFPAPIKTTPQENLTFTITVPKELDGALRVQYRFLDESISPDNSSLSINNIPSDNPFAYQTFFSYHPPLSLQLAGLLIILSFITIFAKTFSLHPALLITPLSSIPIKKHQLRPSYSFVALIVLFGLLITSIYTLSFKEAGQPFILYTYSVAAFFLAGLILSKFNLSPLSILFGCQTLAFTTWYPLQLFSERSQLVFLPISFLFLIFIYYSRKSPPTSTKKITHQFIISFIILLVLLVLIKLSFNNNTLTSNPRDIFLDPNQSLLALKVSDMSWDNFGSYIGIIPMIFALLGLLTNHKKYFPLVVLGVISFSLACLPFTTGSFNSFSPLLGQNTIIITTISLTLFAALGLEETINFLNHTDRPFRRNLILTVFVLIFIISLLDLWQVSSSVL